MNFLKLIFSGVTAVALACSFHACGFGDDDEPGEENTGNGEDTPDTPGTDDVQEWEFPSQPGNWTPSSEEAKSMLEDAAASFLDNFRPADQSRLIGVAGSFIENYGDFDFFGTDDDDDDFDNHPYRSHTVSSKGVRSFFNSLNKAAAAGDLMSLSRAAVDVITFDNFSGIYEPDMSEETFVRTGDSSSLQVRFYNNGNLCELIVEPVGSGYWTVDTSRGHNDVDSIIVPEHIRFNLRENGTSLAGGELRTMWRDNAYIYVDATCHAANIIATAVYNSDNDKGDVRECLFVDNRQIMESRVEVRGSRMVSSDALATLMKETTETWSYGNVTYTDTWYDFDSEAAAGIFRAGEGTSMIDGGLLVDASIPSTSAFSALGEGFYDSYDYDSQDAALADCEDFCRRLNEGAVARLRFADSAHFATLQWRPRVYVNPYYTAYWYIEPEGVIAFEDGTTYALEEYAKTNFIGIQSRFSSLMRAYASLFNASR